MCRGVHNRCVWHRFSLGIACHGMMCVSGLRNVSRRRAQPHLDWGHSYQAMALIIVMFITPGHLMYYNDSDYSQSKPEPLPLLPLVVMCTEGLSTP